MSSNDPECEVTSSDINYVSEAETLVSTHKDVTMENALTINQNLQENLKELKRKLETLLSECRAKYKSNEEYRIKNIQLDVPYKNVSLLVEESETDPECEVTSSDINYVSEAETLVSTHKDVTMENALTINQNLQENLKELKRKLETLLSECRAKYKSNEEYRIKNIQLSKQRQSNAVNLRSKSYYFAGKPYFKTMELSAPPFNADYLYRFKTMKEYFPIDHLEPRQLWSAKDKQLLVKGVKAQLLKFLSSQQRDATSDATKSKRRTLRKRKSILNGRSLECRTFNELFQLAQNSSFQIDWFIIATKDLSDRHTATECIGIWNNVLNPSINQRPFTEEEGLKLLDIADEFGCQNWDNIGLQLNGRSGYECIIHYQRLINDENVLKNCKWTKEEDQQLIAAVESVRMGTFIPWTNVTDKMPFRSKVQVYQRYMYKLKPDMKRERFTTEEDAIITAMVKEHGPHFDKFAMKLLPGRTVVQIRQRYQHVLKYIDNSKEWTYEDDVKLMELTTEMGTSDWVNISKRLIHHTRMSCRTRYTTITKFLKKNSNSELKDIPRRSRKQITNVKDDNWIREINQSLGEVEAGPKTGIGLELHEFFKYSYNFQLKPLCEADEPASNLCRPITYMLRNFVYPKDHNLLYGPTDCRADMAAIGNYKFIDDYMMPPNLNTALLLRGLAIMYPDVDKDYEEFSHDSPALQLFKKRLSILLYSSVVASQIKLPVASGVANMQAKRQKM